MSEDDYLPEAESEKWALVQKCKCRCIRCGSIWRTSLLVEFFNCLNCGQQLDPKKHVVVDKEEDIN